MLVIRCKNKTKIIIKLLITDFKNHELRKKNLFCFFIKFNFDVLFCFILFCFKFKNFNFFFKLSLFVLVVVVFYERADYNNMMIGFGLTPRKKLSTKKLDFCDLDFKCKNILNSFFFKVVFNLNNCVIHIV